MSRNRTAIIIAAIMLSLFMASMEATVIATAMPTIVGQLGGLSIYSWVFSMYMLTSTTTVPLYGKLSDVYGATSLHGGNGLVPGRFGALWIVADDDAVGDLPGDSRHWRGRGDADGVYHHRRYVFF